MLKKNKIKAGLTSSLPPVLQLVQRGLVALGGEAGATLAKPTAAVLALHLLRLEHRLQVPDLPLQTHHLAARLFIVLGRCLVVS